MLDRIVSKIHNMSYCVNLDLFSTAWYVNFELEYGMMLDLNRQNGYCPQRSDPQSLQLCI